MTAFERLNLVVSDFPEHHPVRIAAVTAEYDMGCLANLQQTDIQKMRELCISHLRGEEDLFDRLLREILILDRMIFNRVEDIQVLAHHYRGREQS